MRCPYCQQNIRVQGRFCPKCGEQIFGLPVQHQQPPVVTPAPPSSPTRSPAPPPAPPAYRPFGGAAAPTEQYDDLISIEAEVEPVSSAPAGPTATGLHAAAGDDIGKTCPYCRFPLKPGEQVMTCPACKLPHHADCWRENQGCTTYGCQGTAAATPAQTPSVLRPTAVGPSPAHMGMPDLGSLQQTELTGRGNNALILALVGMLCCAPLALIGLFMGISILSDIRRTRVTAPQASGKAIAAITLGALGTLGWLIYLISMAARQSG